MMDRSFAFLFSSLFAMNFICSICQSRNCAKSVRIERRIPSSAAKLTAWERQAPLNLPSTLFLLFLPSSRISFACRYLHLYLRLHSRQNHYTLHSLSIRSFLLQQSLHHHRLYSRVSIALEPNGTMSAFSKSWTEGE